MEKKYCKNGQRSCSSLSSFLEKNGLLIVSIIFILIVLAKIYLSLDFYAPVMTPDEVIYDWNARMLSGGKLYQNMGATPPLYTAILSLAYHLSSEKNTVYHIMLGISCIVSSLTIFPAYMIFKKYVSPMYAILSAVLVTIIIAINFFSFTLMLENLFIPLLLFTLWAIIEAFDTNSIFWQILAGTSIACLEITRSIGLLIEFSFLLAFSWFLFYNRKSGVLKTLKSKSMMLLSFILLFSFWHLFLNITSNVNVQVAEGTVGNIGTSYNTMGQLSGMVFATQNLTDFIVSLKILLNHVNYIVLASFFIPVFFIFDRIFCKKEKKISEVGLEFGTIYILISVLITLLSVTVISLNLMGSMSEIHMGLGRYLDPLIAPILVLGLISIYNVTIVDIKKYSINYIIFFNIFILIILYISTYDINIFFDKSDYGNNPSLAYLLFINTSGIFPLVIVAISILSAIFIYLSTVKKRYTAIFLLFIFAMSVIATYSTYNVLKSSSQFSMNNDIDMYLRSNSNDQTLLIIDNSLRIEEYRIALLYGFWNEGTNYPLNINDTYNSNYIKNVSAYILTNRNITLPYVATYGNYKLYKNNIS